MKILITGSAGFIGSHLVNYFISNTNYKVVGIDNFLTGNKNNVLRLKEIYGEKYEFIEGDASDMNLMRYLLEGVDAVFHLAAQVSVVKSNDDPLQTHNLNTTLFLNLLNLSKEKGIKRFIFPSSCSVYGDSKMEYLKESIQVNPCSIYASTKYLNELYSSNLSKLDGYPKIIGLRLFNVYGSWQDSNSGYAAVIPIWISRIINKLPPIIYGDGKSTRDFIHVHDVCKAFNLALASDIRSGSVYNIGSGMSIDLLTLLENIKTMIHKYPNYREYSIEEIYKEKRIGEVKFSQADIKLARKELNFSPNINIKDGLLEILNNQYKDFLN